MLVFAIDPGTEQSGYVMYNSEKHKIFASGVKENKFALILIAAAEGSDVLVIETIANMGMKAIGDSIFRTCEWAGRFHQRWNDVTDSKPFVPMYRREVKMHLCGSMRAKDANIRQALLDKFPATGGGKTPQIGTKKQPGPLYGIKSHIWSALALAITYSELGDIENA